MDEEGGPQTSEEPGTQQVFDGGAQALSGKVLYSAPDPGPRSEQASTQPAS